ncbi:MAG: DUF6794 domain-containing protein [Bacteroidota bacterium]
MRIFFWLIVCLPTTLLAQFSGPPNNAAQYEEQYQWRIRQTQLQGVYIPKDLPEAIRELSRLSDAQSRESFASAPEEDIYRELFHGLGRWIRLNWGFNGGSRLTAALAPLGINHPDDLAQLIVVVWHRELNGKAHELPELVDMIKEKRRQLYLESLD